MKKDITFECDQCGGTGWEGGTVPPLPPNPLGCPKCGDGVAQGSGRLELGALEDDLITDIDTIKNDVDVNKDQIEIVKQKIQQILDFHEIT